VEKAIEYEIFRQIGVLQAGGRLVQETRLYDSAKNVTQSMRSKEEADDYRYFPEPDLPPLIVDGDWVEKIPKDLPELPEAKANRFVSDFGLPEYDAKVLTASKALANYYEEAVQHSGGEPKLISNWVMSEVLRVLKEKDQEIEASPVPAKYLGELVRFIKSG